MAAVAVAVCVLASLPGVPGHDQAALLAELAAADAGSAVTEIPPFRSTNSSQPCTALESEFGVGNHLLKNKRLGWYASIWPSVAALDAMDAASLLPGRSSCSRSFVADVRAIDANYWDEALSGSPAFDQGPNALHFRSDLPRIDDSLWLALVIMRAYTKTGDRALLERAEAVFSLAVDNWDPRHGGIYWEDHTATARNETKAIVSNAPAVVLGVELFRQTRRQWYLARSEEIFQWLASNLRDPQTGLYNDSLDDQRRPATVHTVKFTYNQGIMLGAAAALSTVDPHAHPLDAAVRLAEAAMSYFQAHHSYGQPGFDAIWAQNLLWTAALDRDPAFTAAARASVASLVKAEPKDTSSLLAYGGESALRELATLPSTKYGELVPIGPS